MDRDLVLLFGYLTILCTLAMAGVGIAKTMSAVRYFYKKCPALAEERFGKLEHLQWNAVSQYRFLRHLGDLLGDPGLDREVVKRLKSMRNYHRIYYAVFGTSLLAVILVILSENSLI